MSNNFKIVLIASIFLLSVLLVFLFIVPNLSANTEISTAIEKERQDNKAFNETLKTLLSVRNEYYALSAEYQKYSLQLPSDNDISIFTNEVYDIANFSNVVIYSIDYSEKPDIGKEEEKSGKTTIEANLILQGSYYDVMNFVRTIERMPRIVIIKDIIIQSNEDDSESLSAYITAELYYEV
ncbi:MAG: type 4a pilus biogenesis protein PilO [Actinomycetota bacterium]|nr:type 4a pilus biogenesis protein PilO [Actinomycetota bacterium]